MDLKNSWEKEIDWIENILGVNKKEYGESVICDDVHNY